MLVFLLTFKTKENYRIFGEIRDLRLFDARLKVNFRHKKIISVGLIDLFHLFLSSRKFYTIFFRIDHAETNPACMRHKKVKLRKKKFL